MLSLSFSPFPEITTERLHLRQFRDDDKDDLFVMRSDPNVMKYIPRPMAKTVDDVAALIKDINERISQREGLAWCMTLKGDSRCIGFIGYVKIAPEHFRAEVGYMLNPQHSGKGIMYEALNAVIDFGFQKMNLHCIEAITDPVNSSSIKVLSRCGFVRSGIFREYEFFDGKFIDSVHYTLLNSKQAVK